MNDSQLERTHTRIFANGKDLYVAQIVFDINSTEEKKKSTILLLMGSKVYA